MPPTGSLLRLDALTLRNYRQFEHFVIDFHPELTVLVGDNASGKSTVLAAARVALGTMLFHLDGVYGNTIGRGDVRLAAGMHPCYPAAVEAFGLVAGVPLEGGGAPDAGTGSSGAGDGDDGTGGDASAVPESVERGAGARRISWVRSLKSGTGNTTHGAAAEMKDFSRYVRSVCESPGGDAITLPIVASYDTGRLWKQHRRNRDDRAIDNGRKGAYADCLAAGSNVPRLLKWLRRATLIELQRSQRVPRAGATEGSGSSGYPALVAVRRAIERCLAGALGRDDVSVYYDVELDALIIDQGDVQVPMEGMSDGYQAMLGLVADIAYRMAQLNPHLGADVCEWTAGVVLIDEVDLHLHPTWQEHVLADLRAAFPLVQFVVTTHAPSVISSVESANVRRLVDLEEAVEPRGQTYGRDASAVLREVMGANDRQPAVERALDEASALIDAGQLGEARARLDELADRIGSYDPDLVALQTRVDLHDDGMMDDATLEELFGATLDGEGE